MHLVYITFGLNLHVPPFDKALSVWHLGCRISRCNASNNFENKVTEVLARCHHDLWRFRIGGLATKHYRKAKVWFRVEGSWFFFYTLDLLKDLDFQPSPATSPKSRGADKYTKPQPLLEHSCVVPFWVFYGFWFLGKFYISQKPTT